jgi:hypothetical protein
MGKRLHEKPNDWVSIVGMPDALDKKNIEALIETFEKTVFNLPTGEEDDAPTIEVTGKEWIVNEVQDARKQHGLNENLGNDYGEKIKESELRIICALPRPLHAKLLEGYPNLFRDRKMHMWFAKNFKQFVVPRKLS